MRLSRLAPVYALLRSHRSAAGLRTAPCGPRSVLVLLLGLVVCLNTPEAHAVPTQLTITNSTAPVTLDTDFSYQDISISGSSFSGKGNVTASNSFTWSGGTITGTVNGVRFNNAGTGLISGSGVRYLGNRNLVNQSTGTMTWNGGGYLYYNHPNARITNNGRFTFNNNATNYVYRSGTGALVFQNNATLQKTGSFATYLGNGALQFNNTGTTSVSSASLYLRGNVTDTGTTTVATGAALHYGDGTIDLTNATVGGAGSFWFDAGALATLGAGYAPTGSTFVNGGSVDLAAGSTGSLIVQDGTATIGAGSSFRSTNTSVTGVGVLQLDDPGAALGPISVEGGRLVLGTANPSQDIALQGGVLEGITHTITQPLQWSAGTIAGTAGAGESTTLGAGATVNGVSALGLRDRELIVPDAQTLAWTGSAPWSYTGESAITNLGTFRADSATAALDLVAADALSRLTVRNLGLFETLGARNTRLGEGATLRNEGGTVRVIEGELEFAATANYLQTGGVTRLDGGDIRVAAGGNPLQILGGSLAGSGTIFGDLEVAGTMAPGYSPGQITVTGDWTLTDTSSTQIELGGLDPGVTYDQIVVGGVATLAGSLDVSLWNGWLPGPGDVYTIITASQIVGTFDGLADGTVFTTSDGLADLVIRYTSTEVTLSLLTVAEPRSLVALAIVALGLAALRAGRRV